MTPANNLRMSGSTPSSGASPTISFQYVALRRRSWTSPIAGAAASGERARRWRAATRAALRRARKTAGGRFFDGPFAPPLADLGEEAAAPPSLVAGTAVPMATRAQGGELPVAQRTAMRAPGAPPAPPSRRPPGQRGRQQVVRTGRHGGAPLHRE